MIKKLLLISVLALTIFAISCNKEVTGDGPQSFLDTVKTQAVYEKSSAAAITTIDAAATTTRTPVIQFSTTGETVLYTPAQSQTRVFTFMGANEDGATATYLEVLFNTGGSSDGLEQWSIEITKSTDGALATIVIKHGANSTSTATLIDTGNGGFDIESNSDALNDNALKDNLKGKTVAVTIANIGGSDKAAQNIFTQLKDELLDDDLPMDFTQLAATSELGKLYNSLKTTATLPIDLLTFNADASKAILSTYLLGLVDEATAIVNNASTTDKDFDAKDKNELLADLVEYSTIAFEYSHTSADAKSITYRYFCDADTTINVNDDQEMISITITFDANNKLTSIDLTEYELDKNGKWRKDDDTESLREYMSELFFDDDDTIIVANFTISLK